MYRIIGISLIITLSYGFVGCASSGPQKLQNGLVYMIDDKCKKHEFDQESTDISCFDSNGKLTGKRSPMNQEQIDQYFYNQQQLNYQQDRMIERNRPRITSCSRVGFYTTCSSF